jgi:uncharacterized membrane protein YoaK (UPF0700 family)
VPVTWALGRGVTDMGDRPGEPWRPGLTGALAFASGSLDAAALMGLGGAFTSVVTGNLVFTGRALGTWSGGSMTYPVIAVAGFVGGVAVGTWVAGLAGPGSRETRWPWRATRVLALESAILLVLNVAWLGYGGRPTGLVAGLMLFFAALALGSQSAAARNISGTPSTTYMTGALTTLIEALCRGRRADPSAVFGLAGLVSGAAVSAALITSLRPAALLPALLAVVVVLAVKLRDHGRQDRVSADPRSQEPPRSDVGTAEAQV